VTCCRRFSSTAVAVTGARRFVAGLLGDSPREVVDAVTVMVSELAANCVVHAGTEFEVCVHRSPSSVRVEVTDGSSTQPALQAAKPDDLKGRGVFIVDALADDWGVSTAPAGREGKTVWFSVDRGRAASPERRSAR